MPPLLTLPNAGMRVSTSTISRAASSTLHSSSATVGQPVVSAPGKKTLPLRASHASSSAHSRRRTRASAHQAVPILSLDRPEEQDEQLSAALPLALPLWPNPEEEAPDVSTSADASSASEPLLIAQQQGDASLSKLASSVTAPDVAAAHTEALSEVAVSPMAEEGHMVASSAQDEQHSVPQLEALPQPQDGHHADEAHLHTQDDTFTIVSSSAAVQEEEQSEEEAAAAPEAAGDAEEGQGLHGEDSAVSQLHACQQQDATPAVAAAPDERFGEQWVRAQPFYPQQHLQQQQQQPPAQPQQQPQHHAMEQEQQAVAYYQGGYQGGYHMVPYAPSSSTACSVSGASMLSASFHKDQNSVTIKADTKVKDAAGAIAKVLDRLCSTLVTALQQPPAFAHHPMYHHHHEHQYQYEPQTPQTPHSMAGSAAPPPQQQSPHEALNRAVKALAVCRKYITDASPADSGVELGFFPVNRSDAWGRVDPSLFSFLAFKSVVQPGHGPAQQQQQQAKEQAAAASSEASPSAASSSTGGDAVMAAAAPAAGPVVVAHQAELHVSSNSDPATLASNLVRTVLEQGQAVMKAGGGNALFVAMTAVVQARAWLKGWHATDILLVPQWITEDTRATLGRESKFVQFNVLPSGLHGVLQSAGWAPAIVPMQPPPAFSSSGSSSSAASTVAFA